MKASTPYARCLRNSNLKAIRIPQCKIALPTSHLGTKYVKVHIFMLVAIFLLIFLKVMIVTDFDEWKVPTSRQSGQYVVDTINSTLILPHKFKSSASVVVVVFSHPLNKRKRNIIRLTWGNMIFTGQWNTSMLFLLGAARDGRVMASVFEEAAIHGDILVANFHDIYKNLTVKSLKMLDFANRNLKRDAMLFKVDDDTSLHLENLFALLNNPDLPTNSQISGALQSQAKPIRWASRFFDENLKWLCPKWIYPQDVFPDFVTGAGYLIPVWMTRCLLTKANDLPLIHLEDVYVTGMLAKMCGFRVANVPGFYNHHVDPCTPGIVASHYATTVDQLMMHLMVESRKYEKDCYEILKEISCGN